MVILHFRRYSRALLVGALLVSGMALAAPPAAASTGGPAATAICGTKTSTHLAAPGVGKSGTYTASSAGTVTIQQQSQTTLNVTGTTPQPGWKATVITATGTTVHVGFQGVGAPTKQERFWARLNSTGTKITIVLQSCT